MSRKVAGTTFKVVLFSSLMMVAVSTAASAGGTAVSGPCTASTPQAFAASYIHGGTSGPPLDACITTPVIVGCPVADAVCVSPPNGLPDIHGDLAYAHSTANLSESKVRTKTSGVARAGFRLGTASVLPSTADSIDIAKSTTGPNQIQFTLKGEMFCDPSQTDQKQAAEDLTVKVYASPAAMAAGTVFAEGGIHTSGNKDLSQATFSGFFSAGEFTVTHGAGNTIKVEPAAGGPGATHTETVDGLPDPSQVCIKLEIESQSLSVPGASPVGLILLTILLAAVGFYVLQIRRRTATV